MKLAVPGQAAALLPDLCPDACAGSWTRSTQKSRAQLMAHGSLLAGAGVGQ